MKILETFIVAEQVIVVSENSGSYTKYVLRKVYHIETHLVKHEYVIERGELLTKITSKEFEELQANPI